MLSEEWNEIDWDEVTERVLKNLKKSCPEWFGDKSKPRDPNRIPIILAEIEKIWKENPDLRLCQLIGNCFGAGDNYYKEDDVLLERLKEVYGKDDSSKFIS